MEEVKKLLAEYSPYIAMVAIFGVGLLSMLVLSMARDLKRIKEWAGKGPERAREYREGQKQGYHQMEAAAPSPFNDLKPKQRARGI